MNCQNKVTNTNVYMSDNISVYLVQGRRKWTNQHLSSTLQKVSDRQLLQQIPPRSQQNTPFVSIWTPLQPAGTKNCRPSDGEPNKGSPSKRAATTPFKRSNQAFYTQGGAPITLFRVCAYRLVMWNFVVCILRHFRFFIYNLLRLPFA